MNGVSILNQVLLVNGVSILKFMSELLTKPVSGQSLIFTSIRDRPSGIHSFVKGKAWAGCAKCATCVVSSLYMGMQSFRKFSGF